MKKLFLLTSILLSLYPIKVDAKESNRVNIYYDENIVCIQRTNKCWAFAKGKSSYPTPTWEGSSPLSLHIKNGFKWQNPLTGKIFGKGLHNLGDIWIEFYRDDDPLSKTYGWSFGFHQTPEIHTPLHLQYSHGCLRMTPKDIKDFSNSLQKFDEFFIIRNQDFSNNYLYNNLLGQA